VKVANGTYNGPVPMSMKNSAMRPSLSSFSSWKELAGQTNLTFPPYDREDVKESASDCDV